MSAGEVIAAARSLARHGLVDAFGHVSARVDGGLLITAPEPLATVSTVIEVPLVADGLPPEAPKEAWLHIAIYRQRPDVGGICRAQPRSVNAAASIRARHGQGAWLGEVVPVHADATLVRSAELGAAVADTLNGGDAVVLRGNGAVTVAPDVGIATALMYVLEDSARVNLLGQAAPLTRAEIEGWRLAGPELLGRLWKHLASDHL
jgi:HCOMODA/2-hydroxy-3-carboxy-muconic semialdehyde decarboxylase